MIMEVARLEDLDISDRILGSGSYSQVRLARHRVTGKKYAVKIVGLSDKNKAFEPEGKRGNVQRDSGSHNHPAQPCGQAL